MTLTGPGGAGKTRLALEMVRDLSDGGLRVAWASLADLRDGALIPDRILVSLGAVRQPDQAPLGQIQAALELQPTLLILDNFEHLIEEGVDLIQELLERSAGLQCVVTSRQRLNLEGEREVSVRPLRVPDESSVEGILACESVQLFVDRARAVNPEFEVNAGNAASIREVCAQLEGIPLAIELAASRAHVLTPEETVEQLGRRFEFLVSRQRHTEARHRTLAAAVEWSFRLLTPELQRFFARLSVFRGGWTAEAAQSVCMEALDGDALEFLAQLRECSLVVSQQEPASADGTAATRSNRTRFSMLETLRQFAATRLDEDDRRETHQRHRDWCLQLVLDAMPRSHTPEIAATLERLDRETANFWAALDWSRFTDADPQVGMQFCGVMGWFWSIRGFSPLTREYVLEILWRSDAAPSLHRARALFTASYLDRSVGNSEGAWKWAEEALAICRELDDEGGMSMCTATMARLSFERGDFSRCRELHQETLDLKTRRGDEMGVAMSMVGLGRLALLEGDLATAREWFEKSRDFSERHHDQICISSALNQLSQVERREGNLPRARDLATRALSMQRATGYRHGMAASMQSMARCALSEGRHEEARALLTEAFAIRSEFGNDVSMAEMVQVVALLGVVMGEAASVAPIVAYSLAQHEAGISAVALLDRSESDRAARIASETVGADAWSDLRQEVSRWRVEDAVALARSLLSGLGLPLSHAGMEHAHQASSEPNVAVGRC